MVEEDEGERHDTKVEEMISPRTTKQLIWDKYHTVNGNRANLYEICSRPHRVTCPVVERTMFTHKV